MARYVMTQTKVKWPGNAAIQIPRRGLLKERIPFVGQISRGQEVQAMVGRLARTGENHASLFDLQRERKSRMAGEMGSEVVNKVVEAQIPISADEAAVIRAEEAITELSRMEREGMRQDDHRVSSEENQ